MFSLSKYLQRRRQRRLAEEFHTSKLHGVKCICLDYEGGILLVEIFDDQGSPHFLLSLKYGKEVSRHYSGWVFPPRSNFRIPVLLEG